MYWATHQHPRLLFLNIGRDRKSAATATTPMAVASVQGVMRRVVEQLGFRKSVHVHTLKHSYATHLLEAGVNLRLIQQYLGPSPVSVPVLMRELVNKSLRGVS